MAAAGEVNEEVLKSARDTFALDSAEYQDVPKEIADTLELTQFGQDAVDGASEVVEVVRNNIPLLVGVGVVGLGIGLGVGYFIAAKRLGKKFDEQMAEEIAQAKEFYSLVNKTSEDGELLTPQDVMAQRHGTEAAAEAFRGYQGRNDEPHSSEIIADGEPYDDVRDEAQIQKLEKSIKSIVREPDGKLVAVTEKEETVNVFNDPTFDLEEEIKYRTEDEPYIITHDEYFAAEKDYETIALTYFETDDTLVNEQDQPVEDTDTMIGDDHLVRFGHGSKDKNIVYVRNDKLGVDFEISKSSGSYLEEVLGIPDEEPNSLKHSDQRDRRRAFRHGDG